MLTNVHLSIYRSKTVYKYCSHSLSLIPTELLVPKFKIFTFRKILLPSRRIER
jgi:hypothetical protein